MTKWPVERDPLVLTIKVLVLGGLFLLCLFAAATVTLVLWP